MIRSAASAHLIINHHDVTQQTEAAALVASLQAVRGMHRVELNVRTKWNGSTHRPNPTGWASIGFRGTDRAVLAGKNLVAFSALQPVDPNADHDHAACIASARAQGVPAEWAHRIETYLCS